MHRLGHVLLFVCFACSKPIPSEPTHAPPPSTASAPLDANCGFSPHDWCPSPPGDPCGRHKNVAECRADARCRGLPYRGESLIACQDDGQGFWNNCPAVGCVSLRR